MSRYADEQYAVYNEQRVTARKSHACGACHETIAIGHRYVRVGIVFDREGSSVKRCLRCQAIHEHLRDLGDYDVWPDERLDCGEEYEAHWRRPPPEEIARLAFLTADEAQRTLDAGPVKP